MTGPVRGVAAALVLALSGVGPAGAAPAEVSAPTPSTTALTIEGTPAPHVVAVYGQPLVGAAQVTVPGATPDGWVYFVVDGVSRRADVAADGTASTTIEGLDTGRHRVSATFVPRDPFQQDGSASPETAVEVERAVPQPRLRVTGRRAGRVLGVRVRVRTPYGTDATGRVAVTLRRRGEATKRTERAHLELNTATVALGRAERGSYRVVARYPGDARTSGFRLVRDVRVRRR